MTKEEIKDDRVVKLIGTPILGILIPNITGLITNGRYTVPQLLLSYMYFIAVAWIVWQGNVRLVYFIRQKYEWRYKQYYKNILLLFLANVVYSGFVSLVLLRIWKGFSKEIYPGWGPVMTTVLIIVIAACFITNIYEIIYLNQEREYNLTRAEQLNIAKAQAELEALKNQIDPHFIFNSLNTLSFLITRDPQSARLYNDTLAKVYRYILGNKDKDLVLLREEVEFISNYFYLLKIRFSEAVNMEIEITDLAAEDFLIPPISLQTLVENAIKHNEFTDNNPLTINVSVLSNYVVIKNPIKPKNYASPTSRIGLNNLDNRYKLITKRNIIIENNFRFFTVKLPILKF
ncbi:MAG: histidine kinase [Bacteroidetes bacterium]|nr:MAG: histidine kinase [Bacteroidota bacterium]